MIEEVSLALWNGYSLTSTGSADQIIALPFIFVLVMVPVLSLMPFFARIASPRRQLLAALSLVFWAVLLLVPVTRKVLGFLPTGLLYATWWHPIQSTAGIFWALLPIPAAAVGTAYTLQHRQAKLLWTGPLGVAGGILVLLLAFSGRDNSLCLGQWYGNFSPPPQSNPSAVHLVSLHLGADCKGSLRRGYVAFPEAPNFLSAKRYQNLFSGDVRWMQTGRNLRLYQQAAAPISLVAEGTVSADAKTIFLHFTNPAKMVVFRRDSRK